MVLRAFRQEGMFIPIAVPEAAPEPLGARGAEEGSLGCDLHRKILCGVGAGRLVPAVSAASAGNSSSRPSVVWNWCRSASPVGSSRVLLIGQALGVLDVAGRLPDQDIRLHQWLAGHGNRPRFPEKGCECAPRQLWVPRACFVRG